MNAAVAYYKSTGKQASPLKMKLSEWGKCMPFTKPYCSQTPGRCV